jgi:hypothetical protein
MQQSPSWEANCLELVKKFPAFYGTRRLLTALTSARHLSLSWASPVQSSHPHPTSWRSILILSSHLRLSLPNGLFPSVLPTKTRYTRLPSPIRATCPAHLILLDLTPARCWVQLHIWRIKYVNSQRCLFWRQLSGFGGIVVSMLASGTRVRGLDPGRSRWIFQATEKSTACLPSEGK